MATDAGKTKGSAAGTLQSMTGFSRAGGEKETGVGTMRWVWEMRSLNNRGLDLKLRMPSWLDFLEADLRALVPSRINRGSVSIALQLTSEGAEPAPRIDEAALQAVLSAVETIRQRTECAPPTADGLLSLRGVLVTEERVLDEAETKALGLDLTTTFQAALEGLANARAEEGARLVQMLSAHMDALDALAVRARSVADKSPEAIRERLEAQLAELTVDGVGEDRIAQEIAMLAVKADVREELDRLEAHIASGRDLIANGGPVGRKLDFLVQEFNREANTLCSKAQTIELKRAGLEMKGVVDQLREQVQNVE